MVEPLTIDRARTGLAREPSAFDGRRAIPRTALLERLATAVDVPVVVIIAPAGYGKTTLLSQWAERDPRRAEWIRATEPHPVAPAASTAAGETGRLVLLDDVHALRNRQEIAELRRMLEHVAPGTTVALVGRAEPRLPLARLRAQGRLLELGPDELALTTKETRALLRLAGVILPEREADELRRRTEGWPATTFLAALALRAGSTAAAAPDDRFIADYIRSEHLARLSARLRRFVTASSVLEQLSAGACNAVLERDDSARVLDELERARLVLPLDRGRRLYRYPTLVRDVLHAELELADAGLARRLHGRASEWSEQQGSTEQALDHAAAAGNLDRIASLVERDALETFATGRFESLERRLSVLRDRPSAEQHGDLCIAAALTHAVRGRPDETQHWCDAAERTLESDDSRLLLLRALRCRDGVHQMLDDAAGCCRGRPLGDLWRPTALLTAGAAHFLVGDAARAEPELSEAFELASAAEATTIRTLALCLRALVSGDDDGAAESESLVDAALAEAVRRPTTPSAVDALVFALSARTALRRGDREQALREAARAERLRPHLTYALPWLSALALLQLVHVRLGLADAEGARDLVRAVEDILRIRPRLGTLVEEAAELRRRTRALNDPEGRWASSLTSAEARLLPLLATHLSFREIGDLLFISRNTVKTQAISVYRKLGVSSRSEAVARALDLGLIDEKAAVPHRAVAGSH